MNDTVDQPVGALTEAQATLDKVNAQVSALRAVLVQLLQEVVVAEARLDHGQASLIVKANEQLVLSALGAQLEADSAHGALDEVSRLSGLDALTGLPNRTVLLDRFELAIANARRRGKRVALLFLDLDEFKQINDSFGHAAGDRALQLVAESLTSLVRESDTVSRQGGDEFLVLLGEVNSAADAAAVADKVNARLASYSLLDDLPMRLRASIGISVYPEDGRDAKALIARADAAMYAVKRRDPAAAAVGHDTAPAPAPTARRSASGQADRLQAAASPVEHDLREANEQLILAALGARQLLDAAENVRRRQVELLELVARELSDPYAPIRLAASTLGIPSAQTTLLPRVQAVIEEQVERLARMVNEALDLQSREADPVRPGDAASPPRPGEAA